ncbi:MAG: hypothetical protein R3A80_07300 [Bdellovibrionota bacterium]
MYLFLILFLSACATRPQSSPVNTASVVNKPAAANTGLQLSAQLTHFETPIEGVTDGIRVENALPESPSGIAGIKPGDYIIGERSPQAVLDKIKLLEVGSALKLKILSGVTLKDVVIKIGKRSLNQGNFQYSSAPNLWKVPTQSTYLEKKVSALADKDLQEKFTEISSKGDQLRPLALRFIQENPLAIHESAQSLLKRFQACKKDMSCLRELSLFKTAPLKKLKLKGHSAEAHLRYITQVLKEAHKIHALAFKKLKISEKNYLEENIDELSNRFVESVYLHDDIFAGRKNRFYELTQILDKVEVAKFYQSLFFLAQHFDESYFARLKKDYLKKHFPFKNKSSEGLIVFAGSEDNDHSALAKEKTAMIVDVGGDDLYRDNTGIIVDMGGNDRYESSLPWTLGGAKMGTSLFYDFEGNDTYNCSLHCLGASFLGASIFSDLKGDDTYIAQAYSQGSSFAGVSLFIDGEGNDKYQSLGLSQGVGIAGGYGILVDFDGNDSYKSLGMRPSGYGDVGQYESWSQGVGIGLRFFNSGGVGFIYDKKGKDSFEAGTFSQGGGYAFGLGGLFNDGVDDDIYKGMRYTQGFSAHSAVGIFIEAGGNDRYESISVVGEGMAWDLSLTLFEDKSGNDTYQTGAHCLGVASHNSYAFFLDHNGMDTYKGAELPPSQSIGNEYHGGQSLGYFLDSGGQNDHYEKFKNNSCIKRVGLQLICDE